MSTAMTDAAAAFTRYSLAGLPMSRASLPSGTTSRASTSSLRAAMTVGWESPDARANPGRVDGPWLSSESNRTRWFISRMSLGPLPISRSLAVDMSILSTVLPSQLC